MKKPELTPWFSSHLHPTRKGVYERKMGDTLRFSYWNGENWSASDWTPRGAYNWREFVSVFQYKPWRGLAHKPAPKGVK